MWEREEFQLTEADQDQLSLHHDQQQTEWIGSDEDKQRALQPTNICREDERAGEVICTASLQENETTIHAGDSPS